MKKSELAVMLRVRCKSNSPRKLHNTIAKTTDEEIIDSYITCPDCRWKEVEGPALDDIIDRSTSVETFFAILDDRMRQHKHKRMQLN